MSRRLAELAGALTDGVTEAHALVASGNWKLVGFFYGLVAGLIAYVL